MSVGTNKHGNQHQTNTDKYSRSMKEAISNKNLLHTIESKHQSSKRDNTIATNESFQIVFYY